MRSVFHLVFFFPRIILMPEINRVGVRLSSLVIIRSGFCLPPSLAGTARGTYMPLLVYLCHLPFLHERSNKGLSTGGRFRSTGLPDDDVAALQSTAIVDWVNHCDDVPSASDRSHFPGDISKIKMRQGTQNQDRYHLHASQHISQHQRNTWKKFIVSHPYTEPLACLCCENEEKGLNFEFEMDGSRDYPVLITYLIHSVGHLNCWIPVSFHIAYGYKYRSRHLKTWNWNAFQDWNWKWKCELWLWVSARCLLFLSVLD
jgi:hypothetical protein